MSPESSPKLPRHVQNLIKSHKVRFGNHLENIALSLAAMARKDTVDSSDVEEAYRVIWAHLLNQTPWWKSQKLKFVAIFGAFLGAQVLGIAKESLLGVFPPFVFSAAQGILLIICLVTLFWGWTVRP